MLIKVVVGIIQDTDQRILVTQRAAHVPHGGLWEFPGGKVELNEDPEAALKRELQEELGITMIEQPVLIKEIHHDYPDKTVHLLVYKTGAYSGTPVCLEQQQDLRMVTLEELITLDFPKANQPIIDMLISG